MKLSEFFGQDEYSLSLASAPHKPFYIQELGQMVFENVKELLYPAGDGSFQFFPQKILFHKGLLTKQVSRHGEQLESGVGKKPSVQTVVEITKALDVSVEELIR